MSSLSRSPTGRAPCPAAWRPRPALGLAALAGALLAGPAHAFDPAPVPDAPPPLRLEWTQAPGSVVPPGTAPLYGPLNPAGNTTQTMLWAGRGPVALGLGVEQRWAAPPGALASPGTPGLVGPHGGQWLFGLSLQTSLQTRLVWQLPTDPPPADGAPPGAPVSGLRGARVSLDWGHPDPYKGLLRGSLRFELARDTTLSIKPRGGQWSLGLSSKW
ncbi:MAG: hypothetical protein U1F53_01460 [Burkholderiaceae bacterium]